MEFNESYKNFFMICIAVISQMIAILYILEKTLRRFFCPKACKSQNYSLYLHRQNIINNVKL